MTRNLRAWIAQLDELFILAERKKKGVDSAQKNEVKDDGLPDL
ncbi:MAG: hypothetical protein AB1529_06995 [Candidatus Micrarchaeota archaeon]